MINHNGINHRIMNHINQGKTLHVLVKAVLKFQKFIIRFIQFLMMIHYARM
jgi:hypothetical protein